MGKIKGLFILCSILVFVVFSSFIHDYYVSIANININDTKNQLQIELKIDADDLENVLLNEEGKKINLEELIEKDQLVLNKYISKHFVVWVNGGSLKLELIGEELNPDGSFWCYLVADLPAISQSIKVKNDLLLPTYIQQHNIVNLKVKGKVQSQTFINKQTTHTFKIDAK